MSDTVRIPKNDKERALFNTALIKQVVCQTLCISPIILHSRIRIGTSARQITAYLLKKFLLYSNDSIGKNLGNLSSEEVSLLLKKVEGKLKQSSKVTRQFKSKLMEVADALWTEALLNKEDDSW